MSEVLTIGEPLVVLCSTESDIPLSDVTSFKRVIGGAELNVAIGVNRLGHSVEYVSQVGEDPLGEAILDTIYRQGISTKYILKSRDYLTGHQFKQLVTKGDPDVANYRKNSAASHLSGDLIDSIDLTKIKIAHITGIFPAISPNAREVTIRLIKRLEKENIFTVFDTNLRPALWKSKTDMIKTVNLLAKHASIILPGINEGKILTGTDNPEQIADYYLHNERTQAVIVKVGPKGAYVKAKNNINQFVPGFKADHVIDTVGAGDGFALGVITALLDGGDYADAAKRGNAIGALQVQTPGDNDGYPTKEKLDDFLKRGKVNNVKKI